MEVEGSFTIRKREDGHIEVKFEPKEASQGTGRTKRFPTYDGMRRFLTDAGVTQDKLPAAQELRPNKSLSIAEVKVDRERVGV